MYNKADREAMCALSKAVFGSRTRWQKIVRNGVLEPITEKITETVPGENGEPDTTREVTVAVKPRRSVLRRYTEEEIRTVMQDRANQILLARAEYEAKVAAAKEAKAEKDFQASVHNQLNGSAGV